jgi:hypothetical protein
MMKALISFLLFATGLLVVRGASFSTNAAADAFVTTGSTGNLSANNYGGAGSISLAAPGLPQGEFQSVLQFNLSGAFNSFNNIFGAGQWSLQSVTLQLNAAPANNAIFNTPAAGQFGISWMQNDSWTEGTGSPSAPGASGITFTTLENMLIGANDQSLGLFSFNGATSGVFTYSLGLSSGLTGDLLAGENLTVRLFAADGSVSGVFNSRNFGTVANRPLLTVVAVPEPGTLCLGALGVALLLGGWQRPWTRNEFVILEPRTDPAGIHGLRDGAIALGRIAAKQAPFVDFQNIGSRELTTKLWKKAGIRPQGSWLLLQQRFEFLPKRLCRLRAACFHLLIKSKCLLAGFS